MYINNVYFTHIHTHHGEGFVCHGIDAAVPTAANGDGPPFFCVVGRPNVVAGEPLAECV
jgi:hypothetical protein